MGKAWFTLIVTVSNSACAGLSAMLAISVNQLMIEAATSARLIARVGCWLTLALVAASIIRAEYKLVHTNCKHCRQASASTVADSYD